MIRCLASAATWLPCLLVWGFFMFVSSSRDKRKTRFPPQHDTTSSSSSSFLRAMAQRHLQASDSDTPVEGITAPYKDPSSYIAPLSSPSDSTAGSCLGGVGQPTTGSDLINVLNCDSLPLGRDTAYNVLQFPTLMDFLEGAELELTDMFGIFGIDPPQELLQISDLPVETALCLVCNEDMFAIRFATGLPTELPCTLKEGFWAGDLPQYNLAIRFQVVGLGVAWGDGPPGMPNLPYGTARNTDGRQVNSPKIYDGLAQIPLQVPQEANNLDFDFWLSIDLNFLSLANHKLDVADCQREQGQVPEIPIIEEIKGSIKFVMTVDLYINTAGDEVCVLIVVPVAQIKSMGMLPLIDVGSGLGGYCRTPNDACIPDGFFLNLVAQPQLQSDIQGVLGDVLNLVQEAFQPPEAVLSLGFFLDKTTGEPTAALLQAILYISNEELERRRESITTRDPSNTADICPRYRDCETWKRYKLVNRDGSERVDPDTNDLVYPDRFICANVLENRDEIDGVGNFNRKLYAKVPADDIDNQTTLNPSPREWHVQDFFQGYDIFVANFQFSKPAVNPQEDFGSDEYREAACLAQAENDRLFVYIEVEASISIASIINFDGRLTIANVPVTDIPEIDQFDDPNKWILDAFANLSILGVEMSISARAEWIYLDGERQRRRLQDEDPCADVNRRLQKESNYWHRALQDSVALDQAPITYSVSINCQGLECLEQIGQAVLQALGAIVDLLKFALDRLVDAARQVFEFLEGVLADALSYLEDVADFIQDGFDSAWETVGNSWDNAVAVFNDRVLSDGFQFGDLVEIGKEILLGIWNSAVAIGEAILGVFGIGFGRERSVGQEDAGDITEFGCPLYIALVERCDACIFWGAVCFGCRVENSGDPFVEEDCLEVAATTAQEGQENREYIELLSVNKTKDEEQENKGFYTYVETNCKSDQRANCEVATPARFNVSQDVSAAGSRPASMNLEGSRLQGDSDEISPIGTDDFSLSALDFGTAIPECDPGNALFDETFLIETENGNKICSVTRDNIDGWFGDEAVTTATKFAQGTALGLEGGVYANFVTEEAWLRPNLTLPSGETSYSLQLDCDDPIFFVNGNFTQSRVVRVEQMQAFVLENSGLTITLDVNLQGTNYTNQWRTSSILESCTSEITIQRYTVVDSTGKQSNPVEFSFRVDIVPPSIEVQAETVYLDREDTESINPFVSDRTGSPGRVRGGCFMSSFRETSFSDRIDMDSDTCTVTGIRREWRVNPPRNNFTQQYDEDNFGSDQCSTNLAGIVEPTAQRLVFLEEDKGRQIPRQCMKSPLRISGHENLARTGLPTLDILQYGLRSIQRNEVIYKASTWLKAKLVYARHRRVKVRGVGIKANSFRSFSSNDRILDLPNVLERIFYVSSGDKIRHRKVLPGALNDYLDLCQDNQVLGFQVRIPKNSRQSSSRSMMSKKSRTIRRRGIIPRRLEQEMEQGETNIFRPRYEDHYICFQAVCGQADSNKHDRALAERKYHVRRLEEESRSDKDSTETRQELHRRLKAEGPYVDVYARVKEQISRNLKNRRRQRRRAHEQMTH